jgi:hypothetical protein
MALRHGANMTAYARDLEDISGDVARARGGYLFEAYNRLNNGQGTGVPAYLDEATGLYRTADGRWYDMNKNQVPAPGGAGQPGPYGNVDFGSIDDYITSVMPPYTPPPLSSGGTSGPGGGKVYGY